MRADEVAANISQAVPTVSWLRAGSAYSPASRSPISSCTSAAPNVVPVLRAYQILLATSRLIQETRIKMRWIPCRAIMGLACIVRHVTRCH